jgi:hypothetical protein
LLTCAKYADQKAGKFGRNQGTRIENLVVPYSAKIMKDSFIFFIFLSIKIREIRPYLKISKNN